MVARPDAMTRTVPSPTARVTSQPLSGAVPELDVHHDDQSFERRAFGSDRTVDLWRACAKLTEPAPDIECLKYGDENTERDRGDVQLKWDVGICNGVDEDNVGSELNATAVDQNIENVVQNGWDIPSWFRENVVDKQPPQVEVSIARIDEDLQRLKQFFEAACTGLTLSSLSKNPPDDDHEAPSAQHERTNVYEEISGQNEKVTLICEHSEIPEAGEEVGPHNADQAVVVVAERENWGSGHTAEDEQIFQRVSEEDVSAIVSAGDDVLEQPCPPLPDLGTLQPEEGKACKGNELAADVACIAPETRCDEDAEEESAATMRVDPSRPVGQKGRGRESRASSRGVEGNASSWMAVVTPRGGSGNPVLQRASRVERSQACAQSNAAQSEDTAVEASTQSDTPTMAVIAPDNLQTAVEAHQIEDQRCGMIEEENVEDAVGGGVKADEFLDIEAQTVGTIQADGLLDIEVQRNNTSMLEDGVPGAQHGVSRHFPDESGHRRNIFAPLWQSKCSEIPAPAATRRSALKRAMDGEVWSGGLVAMAGVLLLWAAGLAGYLVPRIPPHSQWVSVLQHAFQSIGAAVTRRRRGGMLEWVGQVLGTALLTVLTMRIVGWLASDAARRRRGGVAVTAATAMIAGASLTQEALFRSLRNGWLYDAWGRNVVGVMLMWEGARACMQAARGSGWAKNLQGEGGAVYRVGITSVLVTVGIFLQAVTVGLWHSGGDCRV